MDSSIQNENGNGSNQQVTNGSNGSQESSGNSNDNSQGNTILQTGESKHDVYLAGVIAGLAELCLTGADVARKRRQN